jgi:hypothetical protein
MAMDAHLINHFEFELQRLLISIRVRFRLLARPALSDLIDPVPACR